MQTVDISTLFAHVSAPLMLKAHAIIRKYKQLPKYECLEVANRIMKKPKPAQYDLPITSACIHGHLEILKYLWNGRDLMQNIAMIGRIIIINGVRHTEDWNTDNIYIAAMNGHTEVVKWLVALYKIHYPQLLINPPKIPWPDTIIASKNYASIAYLYAEKLLPYRETLESMDTKEYITQIFDINQKETNQAVLELKICNDNIEGVKTMLELDLTIMPDEADSSALISENLEMTTLIIETMIKAGIPLSDHLLQAAFNTNNIKLFAYACKYCDIIAFMTNNEVVNIASENDDLLCNNFEVIEYIYNTYPKLRKPKALKKTINLCIDSEQLCLARWLEAKYGDK